MTEFELKQAVLLAAPKLNDQEYEELLDACIEWYNNKGQYLMLLSKEANYYTIFNSINKNSKGFMDELYITLEYLGDVKSAEIFDDRIEFWVQKSETEIYCYILFDYTGGVIEIG